MPSSLERLSSCSFHGFVRGGHMVLATSPSRPASRAPLVLVSTFHGLCRAGTFPDIFFCLFASGFFLFNALCSSSPLSDPHLLFITLPSPVFDLIAEQEPRQRRSLAH